METMSQDEIKIIIDHVLDGVSNELDDHYMNYELIGDTIHVIDVDTSERLFRVKIEMG